MKRSASLLIMALSLTFVWLLLAGGCSSSEEIVPNDGDTETSNDEPADGDDATPDGDEAPVDGDTEVVEGDTVEIDQPIEGTCQDFEDGCCQKDADCTTGSCVDHVCIIPPTYEAAIYVENSYYDEEAGHKEGSYDQIYDGANPKKPNLTCPGLEAYPETHDAGTVEVDGTLKVFGVKASCQTLQVDVYTMYDDQGNTRTEFVYEEGTTPHAVVTTEPDENFECHVAIQNVPKGRWLVMKTYDSGNVLFKNTYQWNVYIKTDETGIFYMDINAISVTSWNLVPLTAGASPIQTDRGAIAGTVKDCDGNMIMNATVGLTVQPKMLAYFNADVKDLLPQPGAQSTNADGTFVAINQPADPVTILSMAVIDGSPVILGRFTILMLPDTVSVMGFRAGQPSNYPEKDAPAK